MANSPRTPARRHSASTVPRIFTDAEWRAAVAALKLSPRQAAIVALILDGKKDLQIACELATSIWTVRTHLTRIFARAHVADRMELALRAFAVARNRSAI